MGKLSKIEVSMANGVGRVLIDGVDFSRTIGAINVKLRPGHIPQVFVQLVGDIELELEDGEVRPEGAIKRAAIKRAALAGRIRWEKKDA